MDINDKYINNNGSERDWSGLEDRMDIYKENEMDLVAYFDYSVPDPLLLSPPGQQTNCSALNSFIEIVSNDVYNPESIKNAFNELVQGFNTNTIDNLFVQFLPGDINCNNCRVLREVLHSNAYQNVRIFVHGGVDNFTHVIFEVENVADMVIPQKNRYLFNLRTLERSWVDGFMKFYLSFLLIDGSTIIYDNKTALYNMLCGCYNNLHSVSSSSTQLLPSNELILVDSLPLLLNFGEAPRDVELPFAVINEPAATELHTIINQQVPVELPMVLFNDPTIRVRTGLAAQRERSQQLTLQELSNYFHLSIAQAGEALNLCTTAIKHICRRLQIARWPGRRVNSINRQLARLEGLLGIRQKDELQDIIDEILNLNEQKRLIYERGY